MRSGVMRSGVPAVFHALSDPGQLVVSFIQVHGSMWLIVEKVITCVPTEQYCVNHQNLDHAPSWDVIGQRIVIIWKSPVKRGHRSMCQKTHFKKHFGTVQYLKICRYIDANTCTIYTKYEKTVYILYIIYFYQMTVVPLPDFGSFGVLYLASDISIVIMVTSHQIPRNGIESRLNSKYFLKRLLQFQNKHQTFTNTILYLQCIH